MLNQLQSYITKQKKWRSKLGIRTYILKFHQQRREELGQSFHNKNQDYTFDSLFMFEDIQFWKRLSITRYENLCQLVVAIRLSRCLFKGVPETTDDKYLWQEVLKECWNRKHTWNSHPQVYNILSELSQSCSLKVQLFFMPANTKKQLWKSALQASQSQGC